MMPSSIRSPLAVAAALAAMALTSSCNPLDTTPSAPTGGPPPPGFATDMVSAQNAVRANPSSVGGSPAPSPPLDPLLWNDTVAARAQAWADGCTYMHNASELHALGYGENIAATAPPGARDVAYVVNAWASEAQDYTYSTNTCASGQQCGHYTQIVWRSTTVVGCGFRTCTVNSPFGPSFPSWDYWVCDYAPPGNYVGQWPY